VTNYEPSKSLELLLSRLARWPSISEFELAVNNYFSGERSSAEIRDYRAKRGALKKLRDEVAPVLRHVKFVRARGEIRFQFSSAVPDCWLRSNTSAEPHGLEVTIAQSREQHYLGEELNQRRMGRGFLGLSDDASSEAFEKRLASPRIMYATESALKAVGNGIKTCLKKKAKTKYSSFNLLIEAPLRCLPKERWSRIYAELHFAAKEMPFHEIHVIENESTEPFGFQIK
jgi:hypothetical protein